MVLRCITVYKFNLNESKKGFLFCFGCGILKIGVSQFFPEGSRSSGDRLEGFSCVFRAKSKGVSVT